MSRLRRMPYTKEIPAGSVIFTRKGKRFARFKDSKGRAVEAPVNEGETRIRLLSQKWYGEYIDTDGSPKTVPLSTDKTAAEQMLNDLVRKAELAKVGIFDPYEQHRFRSLAEHLSDFEQEMKTKVHRGKKRPPTLKQVRMKVGRIRRVIDGCGFRLPGDLSLERVQAFLAGLSDDAAPADALNRAKTTYTLAEVSAVLCVKPVSINPLVRRHGLLAEGNGKARRYPRATVQALLARQARGMGVATVGYHAREVKAFTHWLTKRNRIAQDPLADLQGAGNCSDHRHDRRPLSEAELRNVLAAAFASEEKFRGMTGVDRHFLYLAAMTTGFRASELASLSPEDFDLAGDLATITLTGDRSKNGETAVQPIPPDVAGALRGYLEGRPAGEPIWPGTWPDRAADMLRIDLDACGIPYVVDGPDGPLFCDFHSLRHCYVALLDRTGATLKQAMHLARHSDPKLTMRRYGRPQLHDLQAAVERFPSLLTPAPGTDADTMRATGTDGESLRPACARNGTERDYPRLSGSTEGVGSGKENWPHLLESQGNGASQERLGVIEAISGGWDRTTDTRLMKPLL